MHYWDFFPTDEGWGRVPLWGFAEVEQSRADGVPVGSRVFGYLPTSSHLVVEPGKVDAHSFRDVSAHRQQLPSPYNRYTTVTADPSYDAAHEDLQILFRPLFMTSFMLADFLTDNGLFGASTVVLSSASSKTSYGTAHLLDGKAHRVGLTSRGNKAFTESLGCYEQVLTYDEVATLPPAPSVYVDVAGDPELRHGGARGAGGAPAAQRRRRGGACSGPTQRRAMSRPSPARGRPSSSPRTRCASATPTGGRAASRRVTPRRGPASGRSSRTGWTWSWATAHAALQQVWLEVLAGRTPPREGHVIQL